MATVSRTLSPGGALLRASRMFSLPSAIPPPPGDHQAATSYHSDTATTAYPTLQTVTTPESFRQRGDWGFKRNFPMRSTARTSTPYLRIKQVDSIEHVTDFASASDHTLALEKWQEMNIHISLPHVSKSTQYTNMDMMPQSVFEDKFDFTAIDAEKVSQAGQKRWKYKGPWLARLTEGEFQKYLEREVRPKRREFRQFLREQLAPRLTQEAQQRVVDNALNEVVPEVKASHITNEQLLDFLRELRNDRIKRFELVGKFLDLAPIEPPKGTDMLGNLAPHTRTTMESRNPYGEHGPPITHPSAGLSYLRTGAFLVNHPVYGPLKRHPPVKTRIFIVKGNMEMTRIGVGGFIANTNTQTLFQSSGLNKFDPNIEGGSKGWVHISSAHINSQGRVLLNAYEADHEERWIQEEMQGEKMLFRDRPENDPSQQIRGGVNGPKSSKLIRDGDRNATVKIGTLEGYMGGQTTPL